MRPSIDAGKMQACARAASLARRGSNEYAHVDVLIAEAVVDEIFRDYPQTAKEVILCEETLVEYGEPHGLPWRAAPWGDGTSPTGHSNIVSDGWGVVVASGVLTETAEFIVANANCRAPIAKAQPTDGAAVDSAKVRQSHPSKPPEQRGEERLTDEQRQQHNDDGDTLVNGPDLLAAARRALTLLKSIEGDTGAFYRESIWLETSIQSHRAAAGREECPTPDPAVMRDYILRMSAYFMGNPGWAALAEEARGYVGALKPTQ